VAGRQYLPPPWTLSSDQFVRAVIERAALEEEEDRQGRLLARRSQSLREYDPHRSSQERQQHPHSAVIVLAFEPPDEIGARAGGPSRTAFFFPCIFPGKQGGLAGCDPSER
jgi:hypothetical protein